MRCLHRGTVAVALASIFYVGTAQAALVTLNVDSALSSLTLSGSTYGINFAPQSAGSLTANYGGTITADLSGGVLTFSGGSTINALNSGTYTSAPNPIGAVAGSYGVVASGVPAPPNDVLGPQTLNGVYRGIVLDLTGGTATDGAATAATFSFASGFLDYGTAPFDLQGTATLATTDLANTSLSAVAWDGTTLTIPVAFTLNDDNRIQNFTGTIVATAVPEPSSFALLALVGGVGFVRTRSRNRIR